MSVFNIIGFLLVAGITISAVAAAGTDESRRNKCDKSSYQTKLKDAKDCIDAVIEKIEDETPGEWNATVYCENKSNLTECITDCFNDKEKLIDEIDSIAGKIIDYTCKFSNRPSANETDIKLMQRNKELLLVGYQNGTQCLNVDKVKNDVEAALNGVSDVDRHTESLSRIIIDSQSACERKKSGKPVVGDSTTIKPQERADSNQTDTTKSNGKSEASSASVINVALLIAVIATCVPGYF